jgi:hypothetical protein
VAWCVSTLRMRSKCSLICFNASREADGVAPEVPWPPHKVLQGEGPCCHAVAPRSRCTRAVSITEHMSLTAFLLSRSIFCGLCAHRQLGAGSRPQWTDDLDDQQQHVHGPQAPSSANVPSSSPSCRRLRIYSRAWFCSGGVVEQEQRPQTHKGHQALGLSRDARHAYTPSTINCELSRILSMGEDILFLARDLACAAKMAMQGGCVGGFGPRSPVNSHFLKIVCCVQQSTSLEQGLCLRLLCRGAPCRCLCLSCGSVCPCEHGLRFLKSSPLRWQSRSIRAMA